MRNCNRFSCGYSILWAHEAVSWDGLVIEKMVRYLKSAGQHIGCVLKGRRRCLFLHEGMARACSQTITQHWGVHSIEVKGCSTHARQRSELDLEVTEQGFFGVTSIAMKRGGCLRLWRSWEHLYSKHLDGGRDWVLLSFLLCMMKKGNPEEAWELKSRHGAVLVGKGWTYNIENKKKVVLRLRAKLEDAQVKRQGGEKGKEPF